MSLAKRVLWVLAGIAALLLVLHLTAQFVNLEVYNQQQGQVFEISNRLDMDDEVSLPTWFSQFLLLAVGLAALVAAGFEAGAKRRAWQIIGVLGVLFSIDEIGAVHELALQSVHLVFYGDAAATSALNAWWLVLPLIAAAGIWFLWWLSRTLPAGTVRLFLVAGIVYLTGAVGVELASNDFITSPFLYQGWLTGIEESLEMAGSILALYAVINYLEQHQPAKLKGLLSLLSGRS